MCEHICLFTWEVHMILRLHHREVYLPGCVLVSHDADCSAARGGGKVKQEEGRGNKMLTK